MVALYALVLGDTGLRCESGALHLQWDDVDPAAGFLKVASGREGHRTKSGGKRWVPMTRRLVEAMRRHMARDRFAAYDSGRTPWICHHNVTRAKQKAAIASAPFAKASALRQTAKLPWAATVTTSATGASRRG